MWFLFWLGCAGNDEPVVRAVPSPAKPVTAEQIAEKREADATRTSPRNLEVNYEKPDGVYIDVHFLGGRTVEQVAHVIVAQLGAGQGETDLLEGKREYRYERGTLTTVRGAIMVIDVPLPEPMRRSEAMAACGFMALVDKYLSFSREFRVTQFQDFRRVVLHRAEPGSEFIVRLTAYKRQQGASGRVLDD